MEAGSSVLFELAGLVTGEISKDGVAPALQERFEDIMGLIKETAESAHEGLQHI